MEQTEILIKVDWEITNTKDGWVLNFTEFGIELFVFMGKHIRYEGVMAYDKDLGGDTVRLDGLFRIPGSFTADEFFALFVVFMETRGWKVSGSHKELPKQRGKVVRIYD